MPSPHPLSVHRCQINVVFSNTTEFRYMIEIHANKDKKTLERNKEGAPDVHAPGTMAIKHHYLPINVGV